MPRFGRALRRLIDRLALRFRRGGREGVTGTRAMLTGLTVEEFMDALAAPTPTPGGGSASAQAGAMAAALLRMMCDLTLGREAYRSHEEAVQGMRRRAESLRRDLLALVDRDAEAYDAVVRALRLPRTTPAEKEERDAALGRANLFAIEAPMAIADACSLLMGMAGELAFKGNVNAVSDVGAAALLAYAGLRGAALSVRVNLKGVRDEAQAAKIRDRVRRLEVDSERLREEALTAVYTRTNNR